MGRRIREAMRSGDMTPSGMTPLGTGGGVVEIDETFIGNDRVIKPMSKKKGRGDGQKFKMLSLTPLRASSARGCCTRTRRSARISRREFRHASESDIHNRTS